MQQVFWRIKIIFRELILSSSGKISVLFKREQRLKIYPFWMRMKRHLLYLGITISMK